MLSGRREVFSSFLLAIILMVFIILVPVSVIPVNGQVLSEDWKNDIKRFLLEVDENTTAEIVVYILDSLYGHGIEKDGIEINDKVQLGVYIFNELPLDTPNGPVVGIGKKGKDNGVLILVVMEEREWRIEVGYGLEGYITDVESNQIAEDYLVPNFQEGNYGEGLKSTVVELALEIPAVDQTEQMLIRGRYVYDTSELSYNEEIPWWVIVIIVIFILVMVSVGGRLGGRMGGGWGGSRGGGSRSGGRGGRSGGGGSGGKW